ncbi:MAG: GGDEF domain-containing protein [Planctomycetota bacterium]
MTDGREILLVGEPSLTDDLARHCGDGSVGVLLRSDPYDALEEMSRRSWPVVVLTAPQPEFRSLCRASRRLQAAAKLLAICSPAAEPEVRKLRPAVLDDYFIYPPTRSDWQSIIVAAGAVGGAAVARAESLAAGPSAKAIAALIEAADSVESLESRLAEMLRRRLGREVRWVDADGVPADVEPLLLAVNDAPRALVAAGVEGAGVDADAKAFIRAVQECLPSIMAAARRTESLNRLAITDHLTGAYNRRYFYLATDQILKDATEKGFRVTLLLYDIDDFKRYNDTYGHAAGDEILRETAALMKQITRSQDIVARIGGDEFAVLFWDSQPPRSPGSKPPRSAYQLSDRFRQAVGKIEFRSLGPEAKGALTISGGLASFPRAGKTCRDLLRSADKALKKAKESGKDAIRLIGAE